MRQCLTEKVEQALSSNVKLNGERRNRCDAYHSFEMHYGTGEDTDFTIQTKPLSEEFKERYGRTARGIEPE